MLFIFIYLFYYVISMGEMFSIYCKYKTPRSFEICHGS